MTLVKERPTTRRSRKAAGDKPRKPVSVDALPEYKEAIEWAIEVRTKAEAEIAREAAVIDVGIMDRLRDLVIDGKITRRQFELVDIWNGVGARGRTPGAGDYYGIHAALEAIALLPGRHEDVGAWWVRNALREQTKYDKTKIHLTALYRNHHDESSESAVGLSGALRNVLASILNLIPAAPDVCEMLKRDLADRGEERALALSEVVTVMNCIEGMRDTIESTRAGYKGTSHDVESVRESLLAAGIDDLVIDCGLVRSAKQMREIADEFGNRARGCAYCSNWFAVASDKVEYDFYDRCPGCTKGWTPGIFIGGHKNAEEALVKGIDEWAARTINLMPKVALVEGTTMGHARELMSGTEKSTGSVTESLVACPLAANCETLCGKLQVNGSRSIPLVPDDGRFESCYIYSFQKMAEGVDDEARQEIARQWIRQMNESADRRKKLQAIMYTPKVERTKTEDAGEAPETEVTVQASLF